MGRNIKLEQLDFRLLKVFIAMLRERHVGRAADALGMSQPAVSTQLARLRGIAGDPLFVRNAQGMQPTPLAREWATPVAGALAALEQALNPPSGFDPAASQRSFIVYMTDVGQTLILNRLVSRIAAAAPGVRLRMVTAWEGALAERLDDGALDLAVGWIPQLKARKTSTLLFKDRYVGVREAPPRGRPAAGPARYAVADVPRSAHQIVAERFRLRALEPVVTSSNFFMLSELLAGTSLTAVVPGHLARLWASRRDGLRIEELPFQLPGMSIRMHWSAGNWRDEGIDWLRGRVVASVRDCGALLEPPRETRRRAGTAKT